MPWCQPADRHRRHLRLDGRRRRWQFEREVEERTAAGHGFEHEAATHQLELTSGDRQSETRSAMLTPTVPLLKGVEHALPDFVGDACTGVFHLETPGAVCPAEHAQRDDAALGELHGVAKQIDEHLAHFARVADNRHASPLLAPLDAQIETLFLDRAARRGGPVRERAPPGRTRHERPPSARRRSSTDRGSR